MAIGREGQNVRLAARLTGWKIDIKGEAQYNEDPSAFEPVNKDEPIDIFALPQDKEKETEEGDEAEHA